MSQESAIYTQALPGHEVDEINTVDGQTQVKYKAVLPESQLSPGDKHSPERDAKALEAVRTGQYIRRDMNQIRIATQIHQLALQGVTVKNTFKEMEHVWESLMTEDKRCLIVEQEATKVKYQLVNLYAIKLIKYVRSIIGLDLIPLGQQDPETRTWKMDAVILNIASNKVKDHEHLFRMFMVNLFGLSETLVDLFMDPTWEKYRQYVITTYDIDMGDTTDAGEMLSVEKIENTIQNWLNGEPLLFY